MEPDYTGGLTIRTILYVAAHPNSAAGPSNVAFETGYVADGHDAVVAFTSRDKLVAQLGEFQPWMALSLYRLLKLLRGHAIVVDPEIAPGSLRWDAARLAKLEEDCRENAGV